MYQLKSSGHVRPPPLHAEPAGLDEQILNHCRKTPRRSWPALPVQDRTHGRLRRTIWTMVWYGLIWFDMVNMVIYGYIWLYMVWHGLTWFDIMLKHVEEKVWDGLSGHSGPYGPQWPIMSSGHVWPVISSDAMRQSRTAGVGPQGGQGGRGDS